MNVLLVLSFFVSKKKIRRVQERSAATLVALVEDRVSLLFPIFHSILCFSDSRRKFVSKPILLQIFRGDIDNFISISQDIKPPIEAKFVRIKPLSWHNQIAIRFELIGCEEISTTAAPTTTVGTTEALTTVGVFQVYAAVLI